MRVVCEILDDVLRELYPELLRSTNYVSTSRGDTSELIGVLIEIERPRARLSRSEMRGKPFTCLGELLWYLSRDNGLEFISYYIPKYTKYSEDQKTVHGGYGPRFFKQRGHDQVRNVIDLLHANPSSRRAVIQLFEADDISRRYLEVPCTTTLQFMVRQRSSTHDHKYEIKRRIHRPPARYILLHDATGDRCPFTWIRTRYL